MSETHLSAKKNRVAAHTRQRYKCFDNNNTKSLSKAFDDGSNTRVSILIFSSKVLFAQTDVACDFSELFAIEASFMMRRNRIDYTVCTIFFFKS